MRNIKRNKKQVGAQSMAGMSKEGSFMTQNIKRNKMDADMIQT